MGNCASEEPDPRDQPNYPPKGGKVKAGQNGKGGGRGGRGGSQAKPSFDEAGLRACCAQYNMIDVEKVVQGCRKNPSAEAGQGDGLGTVKHNALSQGRDAFLSGDLDKANNHFALAYQARCVADYIWYAYSPPDSAHAHPP